MYCDCPILGRCCFCVPLRRGILIFGYLNLFSSIAMVCIYSYLIHKQLDMFTIYHGASFYIPAEICVAIYCAEIIFDSILIYGSHMKQMLYIRVYYYFALTSIVATVLVQIIEMCVTPSNSTLVPLYLEIIPIMIASICVEVYLIILIRSLLKKMDVSSGPNVYDNPLQQVVFEGRTGHNGGIYEPTVVPVNV